MTTDEQPSDAASVLNWSYWHGLAMLFALVLAWWFSRIDVLVLVAVLSFSTFAWLHKTAPIAGYANAVTLLRLLLLLVVACCFTHLNSALIATVLITCLVLDGFDGYLARRFNESSEFGLYFDVETDAFAILLLSFLIWQLQGLSAWVLVAGALRYAYVWIIRLTVHEQRIEPKRYYASVVAVTLYIVMTVRLTFDGVMFGLPVLNWVLWLALAALYASFLRSALYQWGIGVGNVTAPPEHPGA